MPNTKTNLNFEITDHAWERIRQRSIPPPYKFEKLKKIKGKLLKYIKSTCRKTHKKNNVYLTPYENVTDLIYVYVCVKNKKRYVVLTCLVIDKAYIK